MSLLRIFTDGDGSFFADGDPLLAGARQQDPGAALLHPEERRGRVARGDALQLGSVPANPLCVRRLHQKYGRG